MRTDDDTWDINSSVGLTAIGVAAMRAIETHRDDAVFHDPYAELLVAETDSPFAPMLAEVLAGRDPFAGSDGDGPVSDGGADRLAAMRSRMGGFMVARTWFFDDYFTRAVESGIRQVVILASGLDARAYRMTWPVGTVVYELDLPDVLAFKAAALGRHGVSATVDRRAVAIDLRRDWPAALRSAGFDPGTPTAWLAEGLVRYLPSDAVVALASNIAALSAPGSRFAGNFSTASATAAEATRSEQTREFNRLGIALTPGDLIYAEDDRVDLEAWLAEHGWNPEVEDCADVLDRLGRESTPDGRALLAGRKLFTATAP
ncbi:class I SAM-dependent methyltransferase [Tsukamurella soli]|uniref:S-adenosyl-L-methionine-dependent methyltransferase n=1 Tax=Tsukamurella soli TaxID=644556 RepID=A0ABP8JTD4_9ACTN